MRDNPLFASMDTLIPPSDGAIVSRADVKGTIIFVNDNSLSLAGFTRAESIGQPLSIVRHPDMPSEALRDLWDTLLAGPGRRTRPCLPW
jgi:aerotaxis receptor